ncbi:hypothetical protein BKI52_19805 [marine bacterium AO1-C]|nr:hypothetical protein BKI52_19805 [marine bacterium AO1-C]
MVFNIANVLLLFGILQCFIMIGLIFYTRKWRQVPNQLLLAILIVLGLSLVPSFIGNARLVLHYHFLRFIPLYLGIFVFPLLYLYFKAILTQDFQLNPSSLKHLWIPASFWIYEFIVWLVTLFYGVADKGVIAKTMGYLQVQTLHYVALLVLVIFYAYQMHLLLKNTLNANPTKERHKFAQWMKYLLYSLFLGVILELSSVLLGKLYGYWRSSPLDEWLGFSFTIMVKVYNAVILYLISLAGYVSYSSFKTSKKPLTSNFVDQYLPLITAAMEESHLYKASDFSLGQLADICNTTPVVISHVLNNHLQTSFNDFINRYRVEDVKRKLATEQAKQLTLFAIAQEAGFSSKATFYRAFKKFTQQTPNAYLKSIQVAK